MTGAPVEFDKGNGKTAARTKVVGVAIDADRPQHALSHMVKSAVPDSQVSAKTD